MAKFNQSRKSTHTIMSHQGFGTLTIRRGNYSIEVPENFMFENGKLKKFALKHINEAFGKLTASHIEEVENAL